MVPGGRFGADVIDVRRAVRKGHADALKGLDHLEEAQDLSFLAEVRVLLFLRERCKELQLFNLKEIEHHQKRVRGSGDGREHEGRRTGTGEQTGPRSGRYFQ